MLSVSYWGRPPSPRPEVRTTFQRDAGLFLFFQWYPHQKCVDNDADTQIIEHTAAISSTSQCEGARDDYHTPYYRTCNDQTMVFGHNLLLEFIGLIILVYPRILDNQEQKPSCRRSCRRSCKEKGYMILEGEAPHFPRKMRDVPTGRREFSS
jgi:hypothetical protein